MPAFCVHVTLLFQPLSRPSSNFSQDLVPLPLVQEYLVALIFLPLMYICNADILLNALLPWLYLSNKYVSCQLIIIVHSLKACLECFVRFVKKWFVRHCSRTVKCCWLGSKSPGILSWKLIAFNWNNLLPWNTAMCMFYLRHCSPNCIP